MLGERSFCSGRRLQSVRIAGSSLRIDGALIISPVAHLTSLKKMGVPPDDFRAGGFSSGQRRFFEYHRDAVLLRAGR
jgi:hypothetical protein